MQDFMDLATSLQSINTSFDQRNSVTKGKTQLDTETWLLTKFLMVDSSSQSSSHF